MEDKLINFEIAKLAEEKGFREECRFIVYNKENNHILEKDQYNDSLEYIGNDLFTFEDSMNANDNTEDEHYLAPTQSLLQRWIREKFNLSIEVSIDQDGWTCLIRSIKHGNTLAEMPKLYYDTYEKALEQGLVEGLKLIQDGK